MTSAVDPFRSDQLRRAVADPLPHPDPAALRALSQVTLDLVLEHFSTLPQQPLGIAVSRAEAEALLREGPPENGQLFAEVLAEINAKILPHAVRANHPRYFGPVPSAPMFVSVLADLLCAGTNFFAGTWLAGAGPSQVELVVLDWFKAFLGYPEAARGILTGDDSEDHLTWLVLAREPLPYEDRRRLVLYVTPQGRRSVERAAGVIGLRPEQIRLVPTDEQFRLPPAALTDAVVRDRAAGQLPWAVVANAGAGSTGAIDPLTPISDLSREHNLWLHVDVAGSWLAALLPEGKRLLEGIAFADSITLDPHVWFGHTFAGGCVLVRDGRRLGETFSMRPEYLQDARLAEEAINFADHGMALTRGFRSLTIWWSIKVLGTDWLRALMERCCRLAEFAAALLKQSPCFEILSPPQLGVVCFRYVPPPIRPRELPEEEKLDRLNLTLLAELRATGRAYLASTRLRQRVALRFCFANWRTTAADVKEVVQLLTNIGQRLASE